MDSSGASERGGASAAFHEEGFGDSGKRSNSSENGGTCTTNHKVGNQHQCPMKEGGNGVEVDVSVSVSTVDSLGHALAGVTLSGASAAARGESTLENTAASSGFHGANHFAEGSASTGWGHLTEVSETAFGSGGHRGPTVVEGTLGQANIVGDTNGEDMAEEERFQHHNESIQLFLSKDPSQTLGEDVFKLSHSHGNLTALSSAEQEERSQQLDHQGLSSADSSNAFRLNGNPHNSHHQNGTEPPKTDGPFDISPKGQQRRVTESPGAATAGTSSSTRSTSPAPATGQVLYMAVTTPDGRGQVLQPVQMVQIPGSKQMAYVVAGPAGSVQIDNGGTTLGQPAPLQQQQPAPLQHHQQPPVMPLPPDGFGLGSLGAADIPGNNSIADASHNNRNRVGNGGGGYGGLDSMGRSYLSDSSFRGGTDFRHAGGNGALPVNGANGQFHADPAIASLYASPQRPPLDSLLGQVRRLSRDQVGCRLVQQALDEEGPMAASLVLQEGLPFWGEAMVDPFGNYLFQKILEKVTPEERVMLVKSVSTRLVNASLNLHGTRSVQKVVELCAQDEENGVLQQNSDGESASDILMEALAPAAARLCIDSHGNHVIQRIILKLGPKYSEFVFDAVAASVGDVARHRHGCCVIQRCLDSPPSEARSHLVRRIVEKALELMQDAYGNYVVQYVLDVCSDDDVHAVCESVVGKVNLLAIQKFSSNVMEKCLERCSERVKELYMEEMSDAERVRELMMDPFGNYVVQRALSVATHSQAIRLVEAMRPHLVATQTGGPNGQRNGGVRNTAGGRRIIAKICRRFPNFTLTPVVGAGGHPEDIYRRNNSNGNHQQHNNNTSPHHHHHSANDDLYTRNRRGGSAHQQRYPSTPMLSYAAVGGPQQQQQQQSPQPNYSRAVGQHVQYQQQQPQSYYNLGGAAAGPYYDHFGSNGLIGPGPWM